ncbi:MAG: nitronate monooxygenase [Pseudomonadota bacterium]
MWKDTRLLELLDIEHPIIQAPMAGASTPAMAVAAANAGALGSLGSALMTADGLRETMRETVSLTNRAINYNFFCHVEPGSGPETGEAARVTLKPYYKAFELADLPEAQPTHFTFGQEICDVLLESPPKVASFHFGLPDASLVSALKDAGCIILSSATTPAEAKYLEANGADAVIAQGFESGGHRGFFLEDEDACMGTMALVPQVVDTVSVPVIAAGGIADSRGISAALALGAAGAQIGTAFLNTPESGIPAVHKRELEASDGSNTRTTKVFSGRPARGIINRYMQEMRDLESTLPDFPIMNTLTGPLRKQSAVNDSPDFVSLWSGQAVGLNKALTTKQLIEKWVQEINQS